MTKLTALLGVSVLVAAAFGTASSAGPAVDSGLTGKVLRGPVTPVCSVDLPCYAPYKGTLVFTRVTAASATPPAPVRTQTTSRGTYRVILSRGRYRVTTGTRNRISGLVRPAVVSVLRTSVRHVDFVVDTGIR